MELLGGILLVIHGQKCSWVDPLSQFFKEHTGDNVLLFFKIRKIVLFYLCLIAGASQAPMKSFHLQTRKGSYFRGEGDICSLVLLRTQQNLSSGISVQIEESKAGQGFPREASDSSLHPSSPVEKSSPGVW